jgi:hypothetical protein
MNETHLQTAESEITKIEDRIKERDKQFQLLKIQQDTDKSLLKILVKGLEKLKAENGNQANP